MENGTSNLLLGFLFLLVLFAILVSLVACSQVQTTIDSIDSLETQEDDNAKLSESNNFTGSNTFVGTTQFNGPLVFNGTINNVNASTFSYLDATSSIQNQLNSINNSMLTGIYTSSNGLNIQGTTSFTGNSTIQNGINSINVTSTGINLEKTITLNGNTTIQNGNHKLTVDSSGITVTSPFYISGLDLPTFEIKYAWLSGDKGDNSGTIVLQMNGNKTTKYSVFPSAYYGFKGSKGTYNSIESSNSFCQVIISEITDSSFNWHVRKNSTGNSTNLIIVFLIVYNAFGNDYPVVY